MFFQPNLMFVGTARSCGTPEMCFTRVGSSLTHKHLTVHEYSNLLQTFVNCDRKKIIELGPAPLFHTRLRTLSVCTVKNDIMEP
jgi:hypothetical protein